MLLKEFTEKPAEWLEFWVTVLYNCCLNEILT